MSESHVYPVKSTIKAHTHADNETYLNMYQQSVNNPDAFWAEHGKIVDWIKPYTRVKHTSFDTGHVDIRWFDDGQLNVSANCLDRHLADHGDDVAIIWEGDDPTQDDKITFSQLHQSVCRFANALKDQGVKKAMWFAYTCPWSPKRQSPCSPVPE